MLHKQILFCGLEAQVSNGQLNNFTLNKGLKDPSMHCNMFKLVVNIIKKHFVLKG